MKKNLFTQGILSLFVCMVTLFSVQNLNAQCTMTYLYPSGTVTVDGAGALTEINNCNYLGEYSNVDGLVTGNTYQFTVANAYVTVYQGGVALGHGASPLIVTATADGAAEVHWSVDAACNTEYECYITTVQCMSCLTCAGPTVTTTVVDDCVNGYTIDINVTDMGDAGSYDVNDGTASVGTISGTGVTTVGPFVNNTLTALTLVHDGGDVNCNLSLPVLANSILCPITAIVGCASPVSDNYCYGNSNIDLFEYTSVDGSPLTITFVSGYVENTYDILIVYDSDGTTELYSGYGTSGNIAGLTFTSTGDKISWIISSDLSVSCGAGSTNLSTGIDFTVECAAAPCSTPTTISHSLANPARCNISWDAMPGALRYDVHYRVKGSGAAGWVRTGALSNSKSLHYLTPNTEYDYIVRSTCDGTWDFATASDIKRFNTGNIPPVATREMFTAAELTVSPNPARESILVTYGVSELSDVNISITDMTGRVVFEKATTNVEGSQFETVDVSTFGQGFYIISVQSGDDVMVKKFATIK